MNGENVTSCAYCGRKARLRETAATEFGRACPRCVRTADAERMRQADARKREPAMPGDPTRLDQLGRHLLLRAQVELPATHIDYPRQLVASGARLEAALRSIDLADLIDSQESAYDRREQTEYTIRELLWLVRWQTRELAHAGRELASVREQLDDAHNAHLRVVKGGEA